MKLNLEIEVVRSDGKPLTREMKEHVLDCLAQSDGGTLTVESFSRPSGDDIEFEMLVNFVDCGQRK